MLKNYDEGKSTREASEKEGKWLELLLNGESSKEFNDIRAISKNMLFALCKYKKILRQRGRGYVSFIELQKCYDANLPCLHRALNELFLEYYTDSEMNNFLELMRETNTSILDVYNRHMDNPEDTLFSTLTL